MRAVDLGLKIQTRGFNIYAAGDAALAMGDQAGGEGYLGRLIQVWDAQMTSGNQDYELHSRQMDGILEFARGAVNGG